MLLSHQISLLMTLRDLSKWQVQIREVPREVIHERRVVQSPAMAYSYRSPEYHLPVCLHRLDIWLSLHARVLRLVPDHLSQPPSSSVGTVHRLAVAPLPTHPHSMI